MEITNIIAKELGIRPGQVGTVAKLLDAGNTIPFLARYRKEMTGELDEEQLRQNLGAVGWNLSAAQVAKLDAASATALAYPYWHQRGFPELNPPPV